MDRLQSMRVFAKVAEAGSFAAAGKALDLSAAVVTRLVADLEQHLGARLLNRTTRRLSLTETGAGYLERALRILQQIDDAEALAASHAVTAAGTLRLYAHTGVRAQLAHLLPRYAKRYPDVMLDVTLSDRTVDLVQDSFDLGLFINFQKYDSSLVERQLAISEVMLCASPEYIARKGMLCDVNQLAQHDCLNFAFEELRNGRIAHNEAAACLLSQKSKLVSNSGDLLRDCAVAGMGIVYRPSFALGDDLATGRLVRLLPEQHFAQLSLALVYPSRHLLSAKTRSFIEFLREEFPDPNRDPWLAGLQANAMTDGARLAA